ncbi:MAG TPA: hypothetical protein VFB38_02540 [Chthonomonadaceae bacterium]|nr:hypothetical protein [Chthonomonadaceae bacterium]
MQPLAASDFPKVLPLVHAKESGGHLALICSVLEGRRDGTVFVDDPETPRTALVMAHLNTLLANYTYLLGDLANGSFQRFVPQLPSEYLPSIGATLFPPLSLDFLINEFIQVNELSLTRNQAALRMPS